MTEDANELEQLLPLVYERLRELAAGYLRRGYPGHLLGASAVVHEAFIRLNGQVGLTWQSPDHFVGIAARCMRQVLIDHSRELNASKRGGELQQVTLAACANLVEERSPELEALDDALRDLETWDPRKALLVELHFFGGLSFELIAELLDVSRPTVVREWRKTRAWLHQALVSESMEQGQR